PAFFQHAVDLLALRPDEAVMVGDKLTTDILGANRAGIRSIWINRHEMMRSDEIVPDYEISNLRELVGILTKTK
ncbi:MAG: phosphatase-like protein, partial [Bacilli bacterium]|nr:phosphatase-like protein [Bacilli bacterium]